MTAPAVPALSGKRRLVAPEVVQTSAMDCGPASLKCLLDGFGVRASYGRLREACHTDVDGTSIDTIEEVACDLGLAAEQVMIPLDHVLLAEAEALPAIAVVRLPNGVNHFVVVWRRHGGLVQVMDPATGRRWTTAAAFLREVLVHTVRVPQDDWRAWAGTSGFTRPLARRLLDLGFGRDAARQRIEEATCDPSWRRLATLDAAARMVASMVRNEGVRKGRAAVRLVGAFLADANEHPDCLLDAIPDPFWSVLPAPPAEDGSRRLFLRGAVLVRVRGRRLEDPEARTERLRGVSPELAAAVSEPRPNIVRDLLRFVRVDGRGPLAAVAFGVVAAAAAVLFEALLFRGLMEIGAELVPVEQRIGALVGLGTFLVAVLVLELPVTELVLRVGRHLEVRLRHAFLSKIPRLGDRYFASRLCSDMAERSHAIHAVRGLPGLGLRFARSTLTLVFTAAGIAWIDPTLWPVAAIAALIAVGLPLLIQPRLAERDLRARTHTGALSRFYLDAMLGLVPVRTHGAEAVLRREHESLLVEWFRSRYSLQRAVVATEGLQAITGFGLAAWILVAHWGHVGDSGAVLLLVYWALSIPNLGQEVALAARQYPAVRNLVLRLLEPLGALDEIPEARPARVTPQLALRAGGPAGAAAVAEPPPPAGAGTGGEPGVPADDETSGDAGPPAVRVRMSGVSVRAAGHTILSGVDLEVRAGRHVAIVGPSGAGKSSLVGLLLGWHRPATGSIRIDDRPLDAGMLRRLREETAWVDPAVHLWNRSLLENLLYGTAPEAELPVGRALREAELEPVVEGLEDGLRTELGEGGARVSGGEGQRVRFARSLLRPGTRLVVLDEPFRGLQRDQRRELLARAREHWRHATLFCITHDVGETRGFDEVLVMVQGRLVERGAPRELERRADSAYAKMLREEADIRALFASESDWRRLRLAEGRLDEARARRTP